MIYFIQAKSGPVKIGHTVSIRARFNMLATGIYEPIRLVAVIDGGRPREFEIHETFFQDHIYGEWFSPKNVIEYVEKIRGEHLPGFEKLKVFRESYDFTEGLRGPMEKIKSRKPRGFNSTKIDHNAPASIVVKKFGGLGIMARNTEIPTSTIWKWMLSGNIPPKRHLELKGHAVRLKVKLKDSDFVRQLA